MDGFIHFIGERPMMFVRIVGGLVIIMSAVITIMFQKKLRRQGKFQNVSRQAYFSVENQHDRIEACDAIQVRKFLQDMFMDENNYVTLTAPHKIHGIRYIQACVFDGEMIEVQMGVENKRTQLYHKYCTKEETLAIFCDFLKAEFEPDLNQYTKVEFN